MSRKSLPRGSQRPALAVPNIQAGPPTPAPRGHAGPAVQARRGNKFNANGEHVEGPDGKAVWCASESEAERFRQLMQLQADGVIADLKTQPTFDLTVNGQRICRYRADFEYVVTDRTDPVGRRIEDVKGLSTKEFELKRKLFDAIMPIKLSVIEVKGEARHSTTPALSPKTGNPVRSRAGWMDLNWKGRIP